MDNNIKRLKRILKVLEDADFNEIEWEEKDFKIRVKKNIPEVQEYKKLSNLPQFQTDVPKGLPKPQEKQLTEMGLTEGKSIIRSPLVGTFYRAPSPNASAFVNEGDIIKPGQILCIIEAMKLMNEVESDRAGRVVSILVENAHPVEYSEPLFIIEEENIP